MRGKDILHQKRSGISPQRHKVNNALQRTRGGEDTKKKKKGENKEKNEGFLFLFFHFSYSSS
jgi:hypothetical protein